MPLLNLTKLNDTYEVKVKGVAHFGAHLGDEVKDYKKLNYKPIHLFEPQKKLFKKLEESFSKDKTVTSGNSFTFKIEVSELTHPFVST